MEERLNWTDAVDGKALVEAINRGAVLPHEIGIVAGADCRGAHLSRIRLRGHRLTGIDLREADLSYANFHGADLTNADLRGANLTFVNFGGAHLDGTNLEGAILKNTYVGGTRLSTTRGLSQLGLLHFAEEYLEAVRQNLI